MKTGAPEKSTAAQILEYCTRPYLVGGAFSYFSIGITREKIEK